MRNRFFIDYILLQFLFFTIMGVFCGYGSYLLINFGFSTTATGIIMSLGSICSTIIQPIFASIVDNSKKYTLFDACVFISTLLVILSILGYMQINAGILMMLIYIGIAATYECFESLINSVPILLANNGCQINYGIGRATGSLGYAVATALLGLLTAKFSFKIILIVSILTSVLLLIVSLISAKNFTTINTKTDSNKQETISYTEFLSRHKSFLLLILLTIGIYFSFTMVDNRMDIIVGNVGGTSKQQGLIMSFKAMLEIPIIFFYKKIEDKFSAKTLLKVAAFSFTLKSFLYYISTDITLIWITQLTQITSIALEIPAMVSFINSIMDKKELVRGQALFIMSISIASVLSSFFSGIIIENLSIKTMLLICFIVSAISSLLLPFVIERIK